MTPPASPTKDEDGEYTYTFVGWDKPIRTVDRDETYTAVFMSVPISVENSVPVQTLGLLDMALIASASAVVTAGAVLAAFFVLRHRKRKKSHLD